jgi:sugar lactone lactonase YvrE
MLCAGCTGPGDDPNGTAYKRHREAPPPLARQVTYLGDLHQPESVRYDSEQDVFFISNMVGFGSDKDANGYVVKVAAGDLSTAEVFAESGRDGVVLDAPKGMAIHGDTLWICDIDKLRGISRTTGLPLATIDLAPLRAVLLNDVVIGADGVIYATDTGILMTSKGVIYRGGDRIFRVRNGVPEVFAAGDVLGRPNGIAWDHERGKLVVASFDPFHSEVYTVSEGGERRLLASGKGRFDGIEPLGGGYYMVAAWNDSSVRLVGNGRQERIADKLMQPADIGFDTRRSRLAVPVGPLNQVQLWQLPAGLTN